MKDISRVDVDDILVALGSTGRYQLFKYAMSTFIGLSEAYHGTSIVFIGKDNAQHCAPPVNQTTNVTDINYGQCEIDYLDNGTVVNTTSCLYGYQYENAKDSSILSDFDLVCGDSHWSDFSQLMMNLGMAIGSTSLTVASDKFGRKTIALISNLLSLLLGIATAFLPNIETFILFRFLLGISLQGATLSAVTLAIEIFPSDKRKIVGTCGSITWGLFTSSLALSVYLVRMYSWRIVQLVITGASAYSLIQFWTTDESLRWLVANNHIDESIFMIKKAAKMNKVDPEKPLQCIAKKESVPLARVKEAGSVLSRRKSVLGDFDRRKSLMVARRKSILPEKMKYTMLDLFKSCRLACLMLILWFIWFTNSLVYFGILLTSSSLAGDIHLNFFLNCIVEIPAAFIYWYALDRYGRKKTAIMFHIMASVGLLAATGFNVHGSQWATITSTVFALFGKMGISGSFNVIYFYTPEIFPTNIRNSSYGSCSAAARIGGMLAPFSRSLMDSVPWAPGAIFGFMCVIATVLFIFLPETCGKELPQTFDDLNALYEDDRSSAI